MITNKSLIVASSWSHLYLLFMKDLDVRKLSAKWFPKCLNADQKFQWCQSFEQLLEFSRHDPNDFMSRLVTMDETWLYHYDLET